MNVSLVSVTIMLAAPVFDGRAVLPVCVQTLEMEQGVGHHNAED